MSEWEKNGRALVESIEAAWTRLEDDDPLRAAYHVDMAKAHASGVVADCHELEARAEKAEAALAKINEIRNSIVGAQTVSFSEHVYPLVAVLNEAGLKGLSYAEARANVGTLIERASMLRSALVGLVGSSDKAELETMALAIRAMPRRGADGDAALVAIEALIKTAAGTPAGSATPADGETERSAPGAVTPKAE